MSKIIVIVEDDDAVRNILIRCLEPIDCTSHSFNNGEEALKFLEKNAAEVDLLIADRRLPGLTGEALIREFQRMNPAAPALVISGDDLEQKEIPVIGKPFSVADFLNKVNELLAISG